MTRGDDRRPAGAGTRRRVLRGLVAGVLATGLGLAGLVAGGSAASAHDFLVSTTPAADTTVSEALTEVSLTFNEPPLTELGAGIAIEVNDPAGATVSSGEVSIVDSTLGIAVAPTTVGSYTVIWQTVSSDGHPVSGEYAFDYQGPVAAAPAPTPVTPGEAPSATATAAPAAPTSSATASATPAPAAADGASAVPLVLVGVGAAVLLLLAVVVVLAVVLRRRPSA
ncbi:copper resistance CopC family protein [Herbiconiux sp. VKM Ac-2851]|uniref:copper resistance CopC family protein n=1 Tax=Herbiconiux sp. VKM Ac-2851 TaxID=2739025 RepID=UPI00156545A2|nr:copper resistance CopC family protein [Herbiconiux sp. VKM Ac-2851]NQX34898.1 copper resistance protein CopC [Herbiconiux sp. VKM Ac-2851]